MPLRVACQMDPIERIDIRGDSTFAILLEAQKRGHDLFYYTPPNLALHGDKLLARGATLKVEDKVGSHYKLTRPRVVDLAKLDVVLLRQDPPFDMAYITTTHLLERIHPKTLVVNDPAHVRNAPEKIFVLDFLDLMPPDHRHALAGGHAGLSQGDGRRHLEAALRQRRRRHLPHLKGMTRTRDLWSSCFRRYSASRSWWQQYRPEVKDGDKRIILIDGEFAGAINRVPQAGETRSNLHVGGTARPTKPHPARRGDLRAASARS
ncbi:MAG: glutathione synthase [Hyphomicrobium sp.]